MREKVFNFGNFKIIETYRKGVHNIILYPLTKNNENIIATRARHRQSAEKEIINLLKKGVRNG